MRRRRWRRWRSREKYAEVGGEEEGRKRTVRRRSPVSRSNGARPEQEVGCAGQRGVTQPDGRSGLGRRRRMRRAAGYQSVEEGRGEEERRMLVRPGRCRPLPGGSALCVLGQHQRICLFNSGRIPGRERTSRGRSARSATGPNGACLVTRGDQGRTGVEGWLSTQEAR